MEACPGCKRVLFCSCSPNPLLTLTGRLSWASVGTHSWFPVHVSLSIRKSLCSDLRSLAFMKAKKMGSSFGSRRRPKNLECSKASVFATTLTPFRHCGSGSQADYIVFATDTCGWYASCSLPAFAQTTRVLLRQQDCFQSFHSLHTQPSCTLRTQCGLSTSSPCVHAKVFVSIPCAFC